MNMAEWIDEGKRRIRRDGNPVIWLTTAERDEIAELCKAGIPRPWSTTRLMGVRIAVIDEPPAPFWRPDRGVWD